MTQPQSPYDQTSLLLMIGQATVELNFLRGQITQLQQRLKELEPEAPDGKTEPLPQEARA